MSEYELMAPPSKMANILELTYPVIVQPILEGCRVVYIPSEENVTFQTRDGTLRQDNRLNAYFESLGRVSKYVLDGELCSKSMSSKKIYTSLVLNYKSLPEDLKFVVYDCVPVTDWVGQFHKDSYEDRLTTLRRLLTTQVSDFRKVIDISSDIASTPYEAKELYKKHLSKGYKGSIFRDPDGLYQWKRVTYKSGEVLKLKPKSQSKGDN